MFHQLHCSCRHTAAAGRAPCPDVPCCRRWHVNFGVARIPLVTPIRTIAWCRCPLPPQNPAGLLCDTTALLPSHVSPWGWDVSVPIWFLPASSDPSRYLACSAEAVVWLSVPKHSCWLQSPDVFLCLHFPLSRLFSNTHSIRVWGRPGYVPRLPWTSIFQHEGRGLLMLDSAVGCGGDFPSKIALPVSPVQYLELSTKLFP